MSLSAFVKGQTTTNTTFIMKFFPAPDMVTKFLECSSDGDFVKSLLLTTYAVETIVEMKVDKLVAQKVASVASIDPYIALYKAPITNTYSLDSSVSTSTSTTVDNLGSRRLPCTTCSCYCAD